MAILLILLDKSLFSVQQSTSIAIIFLLCLHSCIQNSNESQSTNDNYYQLRAKPSGTKGAIYQLKQRRNHNLNRNSNHLDSYSINDDLGRLRRITGNSKFYLLSLSLTISFQYCCTLQLLYFCSL